MKNSIKLALYVFALFIIGIFLFLYWAHLGTEKHESFQTGTCSPSSTIPNNIKIISYNIAYGWGLDEAGENEKTLKTNLDRISDVFKNENADIVLLQEVDFASKRTQFIDEAKYLAEKSNYQCYACTTTWIKNYIPFPYWPPSKHFGEMKSGQCVLSRFPITSNERIPLSQRQDKPFFYTAFYLDRALQIVDILVGNKPVKIINTHLEAFDIKNREEHAAELVQLVKDIGSLDNLIIGGDFNALPVDATIKKIFPDQPEKRWTEWLDVSDDTTMEIIISSLPQLSETISKETPEQETFTFPSNKPSRRIDYIFFGKDFEKITGKILNVGEISDHLPVFLSLELTI